MESDKLIVVCLGLQLNISPGIIQMYATIYSTVIIKYILFQILRIISQSWKEMKMASTRRKENFQL